MIRPAKCWFRLSTPYLRGSIWLILSRASLILDLPDMMRTKFIPTSLAIWAVITSPTIMV